MKVHLLFVSIISVVLFISCKQPTKQKSAEDEKNEKIEQAVRSSKLFESSDLSDFKNFEEIIIDYKDLPSYKRVEEDINIINELIKEAESQNKEDYIKTCLNRIKLDEDRIMYLKENTTPKMYRVKFREDIKSNGKRILTTYAQAYINENYIVIDFIH